MDDDERNAVDGEGRGEEREEMIARKYHGFSEFIACHLPWVPEVIFFREIERENRGGAASASREEKITSGHTYPEPHFRASNWDRICPSSLIGCAKETIPVIG